MQYNLTYANVPFIGDDPRTVRLRHEYSSEHEDPEQTPPRRYQVKSDLMDELNRKIPFRWLQDFEYPGPYKGRNLGSVAALTASTWPGTETIQVGNWFYPTGASRWSVFRMLATSGMAKAMLSATLGYRFATLSMQCVPDAPNPPSNLVAAYTVETQMRMLPVRPLGELGGSFDGLYLITLVDDRFDLQGTPISLKVRQGSTWDSLLSQIAVASGITITYSTIPASYSVPEPDSQLWTCSENAGTLLDAIAFNLGRRVVRRLDGVYLLQTPTESLAQVVSNRGNADQVTRLAGGDLFSSGTRLPIGNLFSNKNATVPTSIFVTFPKYVVGDDPVPHFLNSRYPNQRPSAWYEESYGDTYAVNVPIASGGVNTSGLTGVSTQFIHSTAKALYSGEIQAAGDPINASGLVALALQVAQDKYDSQILTALDEVYPGAFAWDPEGIHDIIWTWSSRERMVSTRVLRSAWNSDVEEMQHSAPAMSGQTNVPRGVGGPSVPQTWRDSLTSGAQVNSDAIIASGDYAVSVLSGGAIPNGARWRGVINSGKFDEEVALFEGASGGTAVGVVYRGIDGSIQQGHLSGAVISELLPSTVYGVNLATFSEDFKVTPGAWTSGGISEAKVALRVSGTVDRPIVAVDLNPHTVTVPDMLQLEVDRETGILTATSPSTNVFRIGANNPFGRITSGLSGGCNYTFDRVCWTGSGYATIGGGGTGTEINCVSGIPPGIIVPIMCVPNCGGSGSTCFIQYCCISPVSPVMSGGGSSTISTGCCPGTYISQNVTLNLGNVVSCSCLAGSYTLAWNGTDAWTATFTQCGKTVTASLTCNAATSTFNLTMNCGGDPQTSSATSVTCSPFILSFPNFTFPTCCGMTPGTVSVSVTG